MSWRNRPTHIDYLSSSTDNIAFIDESGTPSLKKVIKSDLQGTTLDENERYFTVTACLIKRTDFEALQDLVMELKFKYWKDALFVYKTQEKRICFHSRDIRGRKEAFSDNIIDYSSFIYDLSALIDSAPFTIISSSIDKLRHIETYIHPEPPYSLCMNFVLERIVMATDNNHKCEIILESRGKSEDKELLNQIKYLFDHGNTYFSSNDFKKISGIFFNPKWSKMHNAQKSYWGLELADLCAYPIHKYFIYGTKDKAFLTLEQKIYNYPTVNGYGFKKFP